MKILNKINIFSRAFLILTIALLAISLSSCSKKTIFKTSTLIPSARGEVTVKKDANNNYNIELNISYLAEPERLNPPMKTYVVWLAGSDGYPMNIGQIVSTSKLHVKFETVSATKPNRIFVTAETDATTQYPSNMMVLESENF